MKCDKCNNQATVHLTEIVSGEKIEKHLCESCAADEGITMKSNVPITQLLEDFILQSESEEEHMDEPTPARSPGQPQCDICGMTLSEFRSEGRLGCPHDYDVFQRDLVPMLERAHEGAAQHIGKVPHHVDDSQRKQNAILRLRAELKTAIGREDYERAAALRDQIKELEVS
ncbi:MAG: UvrB/UvrC motif-containing protein [Phycisphaerae bacterium]